MRAVSHTPHACVPRWLRKVHALQLHWSTALQLHWSTALQLHWSTVVPLSRPPPQLRGSEGFSAAASLGVAPVGGLLPVAGARRAGYPGARWAGYPDAPAPARASSCAKECRQRRVCHEVSRGFTRFHEVTRGVMTYQDLSRSITTHHGLSRPVARFRATHSSGLLNDSCFVELFRIYDNKGRPFGLYHCHTCSTHIARQSKSRTRNPIDWPRRQDRRVGQETRLIGHDEEERRKLPCPRVASVVRVAPMGSWGSRGTPRRR
eukprot:1190613-Prorocentrum_minimum.AAC.2